MLEENGSGNNLLVAEKHCNDCFSSSDTDSSYEVEKNFFWGIPSKRQGMFC